jgi:hypothetical protein
VMENLKFFGNPGFYRVAIIFKSVGSEGSLGGRVCSHKILLEFLTHLLLKIFSEVLFEIVNFKFALFERFYVIFWVNFEFGCEESFFEPRGVWCVLCINWYNFCGVY